MRHLISVLVGLVLGFVVYVLLGYGAFDFQIENGLDGDNVPNLLAFLAAGVAYAVLVVPRLSPIGPALVGLAYLVLGLWLISDVRSFVDVMPTDLLGLTNAGIGGGIVMPMLAIPLLATAASPLRWRRRVSPVAPGVGGRGTPPPPPPYGQPDQPPAFDSSPQYGGQSQYGNQPQYGDQQQYGNQQPAGYPGAPPIGAPYSGPPSYGASPGSPVAPSGYPDQGAQQYGSQPGYPPNPDVTRRIQ